jgi:ABC-type transport system substrate-binding protein
MLNSKKWLVPALMAIAALVMAACATPEPETIVETVVVDEGGETIVETVVVTQEAEEPEGEGEGEAGDPADVFVTGIFEDIATTNYWNYLGPGADVWTGYVVSGQIPGLYTLGDQRFDYVPFLADGLPGERTEEGDFITVEVTLLEGLTWSDGEALTAEDVVFTFETNQALNLGGNWATYRPGSLDRVEAVDDLTIKFYFTETPGLATFEYGVAFSPILPEHFWGPVADEAIAQLDEVGEAPEAPGDDATEDEQAAYDEELATFQEAQAEARNILYQEDATDEPVFGPFKVSGYEPGAFAEKSAVDAYPFTDLTTTLYDDGTYESELPDGSTFQAYGEGSGEVVLEVTTGPYVNEVVYSIYGSQDAAFLALQGGEIDYVFSPLGLSQGLRNQVESADGLVITENAQNGFRYLAFNTRKAPMSDIAFRQAVATVIDQPFITDTILGGAAVPAYAIVPEGVGFWHNPDVTRWGWEDGESLGRQARFENAKQLLVDAGYSWETEPTWDADNGQVTRGSTIIQPDGQEVPELEMLAPNAGYDPLRATAAVWVEEFVNDLGIPLTANLVPFSAVLIPTVFAEGEGALEWDLYIAGWGLGAGVPDYLDVFFTTDDDSAAGGFNTPGYSNPEFDAITEEFLAATELEEAQTLAYEMQDILAEEVPYVVLFTNPILDVYRSNVEFPYTDVLDGIQGLNGLIGTVQVFQ